MQADKWASQNYEVWGINKGPEGITTFKIWAAALICLFITHGVVGMLSLVERLKVVRGCIPAGIIQAELPT
jgi:hypothetical protein